MAEGYERFAAIDALVASHAVLPSAEERRRLRKAHGLTVEEVSAALQVRRATVGAWEAGRTEPRGAQREAYARLLGRLTELYPRSGAGPSPTSGGELVDADGAGPADLPEHEGVPAPDGAEPDEATASEAAAEAAPTAAEPPPSAERHPGPDSSSTPSPPQAAPRRAAPRPPQQTAPRSTSKQGTAAPAATEPRFADGPLAVLDGDGTAYGVGGQLLSCPAETVVALVEWTLAETRLGAPRLHRNGQDADPLVVLTPQAAARLGLPERAEDMWSAEGGRRLRGLPSDHPVLVELADAGWLLTRRGFGPWARIYRPAAGGRRRCVQLCLPGWGALEDRAWGPVAAAAEAGDVPAAELARVLGLYAERVLTPRGSTAVAGLELMTALRPATRPVRGPNGEWVSAPLAGSLGSQPLEPAPPEAPFGHPLVGAREETPETSLNEEVFDWARDPETLTDAECAAPWAVGLDVNCAFLAAANRLTVGLGPAEHVQRPAFDKRLPGSWLVDLSHVAVDPRLPNPFTPEGTPPQGPAWYTTPTVAYAVELGAEIAPLEAWVRPEKGGYLDPWYGQLRDAYLATLAELGVTPELSPAEFLDAMAQLRDGDADQLAVLGAIKATVKGGLGKLRERAAGRGWRPGQPWPALERPTWRPDIRAAVIAGARTAMHRKMRGLAAHGHHPLAVLSDCVVYPAAGPSPLDLLPKDAQGHPVTKGVFVLGPSPGRVKHEGTRPLLWAVELLDQGGNPARHIKPDGTDAVARGE